MQRKDLIFIFFGVLIDQITKHIAQSSLSFFKGVPIIPNILNFQLVHNYGAAYGILQNQRLFLLLVSAAVVIFCFIFAKKIITSWAALYGLLFLLIGTIGNFIDRVLFGYVIDFIDIGIFPVFNIADICINIGIGFFILDMFIQNNDSKTSNN
jgi:signal peptidase II